MATKHVALRIAPELCDEVDAEAAAQGKSRNDMLNYLIDSGLHGLKRYKEDLRKALTSKGLL